MKSLIDTFARLFSADGFVPRRVCGLWPDWLVWEHVGGNALVWLAYVAMPLMIWQLGTRRPDWKPFQGVVLSFAMFIGLCGVGHFLDMLAFFRPMYRLTGHVLVTTGLVSFWTVWSIRRAWPALMAMKSPAEMERVIQVQTEALTRSAERLEGLTRQLLRTQEDERRRIARELHDEIGQALTALKINLQRLSWGEGSGTARLEESTTIVDQVLSQVRGMALDLRPSILDDLGLVPALEWYVSRHALRTGLEGRFFADPEDIGVDPEIETICFRVAQEALTNVARHAKATRFVVELLQHGDGISMVIRDDGIGFDPGPALEAARGTSIGLAGMRERVELVGGRIAFVSGPGRGTEVQVDLPNTPIIARINLGRGDSQ